MTTATATKNGAGAAVDAAPASAPGNLWEKIAAITSEAQVKATGKNEQGGKAMSIADVEGVVGELCGKYGVVTRWSLVSLESYTQPLPPRFDQTAKVMVERSMTMWRSHLRVKVQNATLPDETFEDEWSDIGTNPMAATSFVRKGYYRALFHLAEEADEAEGQTPAEGGAQTASRSALPAARTGAADKKRPDKTPTGHNCPECGTGELLAVSWDGKPATKVECSNWRECKYSAPAGELAPAAAAPAGPAEQRLFGDGTPVPDDPF